MPQTAVPIPGEVVQWVLIGIACLTMVLHLCFALAVWHDADITSDERPGPQLLGPTLWGLTALIFGLLGLVAYWVIHYSRLNPHVKPISRRKRPHPPGQPQESTSAPN